MISAHIFLVLHSVVVVHAYIPAQPTNSSEAAIDGGLNITDISKLHLHWYGNGSYSDNVSYQLAGAQSNGISKGVLVHFSEASNNETTPPTTTPWIAMVSCDANATNASMEVDVFTLARDKGAKAALLYSLNSLACIINPDYANPGNFDHVLDIFSTQSITSARLIEDQFGPPAQPTMTIYGTYDSKRLNDSGTAINSSIAAEYPTTPGYLYAILQAYNATGDPNSPGGATAANPPNASTNSSSPSTALAMIVLYAITGCVSALFIIIIISGAIRAIRHPERYGPRARFGDDGSPPQSRARGITRAILDTFPVVKFGSTPQNTSNPAVVKDIETQVADDPEIQLRGRSPNEGHRSAVVNSLVDQDRDGIRSTSEYDVWASGTGDTSSNPSSAVPCIRFEREQHEFTRAERSITPAQSSSAKIKVDIVPEAIGTETCPICILNFEEGDDLRVLPCEGQHRFHQQCVDPWLLELSSSCPICRHDFHALETMMQDSDDEEIHDFRRSRRFSQATLGNRFSRYLRFARRRRSRLRQRMEEQDRESTDSQAHASPGDSIHGL